MWNKIETKEIDSWETYYQAWSILSEEFPDHEDTYLLQEYEWILVATKKSNVIGVVTANKYIPKKALLCDVVIKKEYRSQGVGIILLKDLAVRLKQQGYTHVIGFTPKKNKEALNTYKRVYTKQEEMIVTTSELNISIPHIEQMQMVLQARKERRKKNRI